MTLGDGVRVSGRGGVIGNVSPGMTVSGFPARPHHDKMREFAASAALPDYIKRVLAHWKKGWRNWKRVCRSRLAQSSRQETPQAM